MKKYVLVRPTRELRGCVTSGPTLLIAVRGPSSSDNLPTSCFSY